MKFEKGDVVQVHYGSATKIEAWMKGWEKVGPGDLGVVLYSSIDDVNMVGCQVTINFPMIGTFSIHSSNLQVVQKASEK